MKKTNLLLVLILITTLVITGCNGSETNEPVENEPSEEGDVENSEENTDEEEEAGQEIAQEIVFIIGDEPTSLDPGLASDSTPSTVLSNTFEGLTTLDQDDNPIPAMAEDWTISEDKLTYTFNLRDDIFWSDGEEITAYDFEYAWKRVIDPETAAGFGYFLLEHIQNAQKYFNGEVPIEEVGIKVIDEKTIEVTLENPTPYFLNLTATWTMFPVREDAVNTGENWFKNPDTFIVNGPFMAEEYNQGENIILIPNPNYYDAEKVKLERIRFDFLEDASNALAAFESGAVDGSEIVPSADIPRLKMESDGFYLLPYVQHIWINFNTQVAPYDDVNVRKALTYAIDREALVTQVLQGGQVPGTGLVPYGIIVDGKDFREEGGDYGIPASGDVQKAKELFAMAGYENGEGFPELVIKDNGKSYIEVVKEMWENNLGIDVTIEEKEFGVYLKEVKAGDYTVSRGGWTGDYGYPTDYLNIYTENGVNFSHWYNEEYMEKLEMAKTSENESERIELMHEAEDIFMEDMPIAPLYYATSPMLVNPNLKGWHQSQLGYLFFRDAQIME